MGINTYNFKPHVKGDTFNGIQFQLFLNVKKYDSISSFPTRGSVGFIYMDLTTLLNYRWVVSEYILTSDSPYIDITNATIKMQLRKEKESNNNYTLEISTENLGITIIDGVSGIFKINKQKIDIAPYNYFYDIEITFIDGTIKTYISGKWLIKQDVTHE
jgi:hypothetical protein